MALLDETAAAASPLAALQAALGKVAGTELVDLVVAALAEVSLAGPEDLDTLIAGAIAAWPSPATTLVEGEGIWTVATPVLCQFLLGVAAREARATCLVKGRKEADLGKEAPLFDKLLDRVCGVESSGWCRYVRVQGKTVGEFCGLRATANETVCATHREYGLPFFLRQTLLGFPEVDLDRRTALVSDGEAADPAADGHLIGCLACDREVTEGFLARWPGRAEPAMPKIVGSAVLLADSVDEICAYFEDDAPPVACAACLACNPMYVMVMALVVELARGRAAADVTAVRSALIMPISARLVPKVRRAAALASWRAMGLPCDTGFGGELAASAVRVGMSPAGKAAFANSGPRGLNLRRREQHSGALATAMGGDIATPHGDLGRTLGMAGEDDGGTRAVAPPSVGREARHSEDLAPPAQLSALLWQKEKTEICLRPGCSRPVFTESTGLKHAHCGTTCRDMMSAAADLERRDAAGGRTVDQQICARPGCGRTVFTDPDGHQHAHCGITCRDLIYAAANGGGAGGDGTAVLPSQDKELYRLISALSDEVASLRAAGANSSGGRAGLSQPQTTVSVLAAPFAFLEEDHLADKYGFPPSFGAHAAHPDRHRYVDALGIMSLFVEGDKSKAFGKAVFSLVETTRIDRKVVGGRFPFSPFGVRETSAIEIELAGGLKMHTGGQKKATFPVQATWLDYLEKLLGREWVTLSLNKAPSVVHANYKLKQSRLVMLTLQFFHAISIHLAVRHAPSLSWPATWTVLTHVFHEYFYADAWQPFGVVKELMEVADSSTDASMRTLTGNSPILASVVKKFLGQMNAVLKEAIDLCDGGGAESVAGATGAVGGAAGGGAAAGPLCGVTGCPGYSKAKGWNCTHVFTRLCDYALPAKAGGGQCGLAHASFGTRKWSCAEAKALVEVVKGTATRNSAFKLSYDAWVLLGGNDATAVKTLVAKYT